MGHKNYADYVAYHAAYRKRNRKKLRDESRQWRKDHPEYEREYRPQYLKANEGKVKKRKNRHYYKNKEKYNLLGRQAHLKRKYGITLEEKRKMIDRQNGKCAICGEPINETIGHTDHQHNPFKLRDILCRYCNPGIGNFRENPEFLEKAAAYLRRHQISNL
jgi:hypothetical protein